MLTQEMTNLIQSARIHGWVMEPAAKQLFSLAGMTVPRFIWAHTRDEALAFARKLGAPVVLKIVSPRVIHKSDVGGVRVGISEETEICEFFDRMSRIEGFAGVLVEEMVRGVELIIGSTVDEQFGPVILLGMGGTATEIYRDVGLAMAPLCETDVDRIVQNLKARELLDGFRGSEQVNRTELTRLVVRFSELVMDLGDIVESIDLNPVMCSAKGCVIADARIMLRS